MIDVSVAERTEVSMEEKLDPEVVHTSAGTLLTRLHQILIASQVKEAVKNYNFGEMNEIQFSVGDDAYTITFGHSSKSYSVYRESIKDSDDCETGTSDVTTGPTDPIKNSKITYQNSKVFSGEDQPGSRKPVENTITALQGNEALLNKLEQSVAPKQAPTAVAA